MPTRLENRNRSPRPARPRRTGRGASISHFRPPFQGPESPQKTTPGNPILFQTLMNAIPATSWQRITLHARCLLLRPARAGFFLRGILREIPLFLHLRHSA